jgi:hypothetical protein
LPEFLLECTRSKASHSTAIQCLPTPACLSVMTSDQPFTKWDQLYPALFWPTLESM